MLQLTGKLHIAALADTSESARFPASRANQPRFCAGSQTSVAADTQLQRQDIYLSYFSQLTLRKPVSCRTKY